MKKTTSNLFILPYFLWIFLFVLAPVVMIIFQSFFNVEGQFSLENYKEFFRTFEDLFVNHFIIIDDKELKRYFQVTVQRYV